MTTAKELADRLNDLTYGEYEWDDDSRMADFERLAEECDRAGEPGIAASARLSAKRIKHDMLPGDVAGYPDHSEIDEIEHPNVFGRSANE